MSNVRTKRPRTAYRFRPYTSADAECCATLYNAVYSDVATFVPVDAETLDRAVTVPDSVHDEVAAPGAVVAVRADTEEVAGFLAFCRRRPNEAEPWHGLIRLVCCGADRPLVNGLIDATRKELSDGGVTTLRFGGSGGVRFLHGGETGLPTSLAPMIPALFDAGLRLTGRLLVFAGRVNAAGDCSGPAVLTPAGSESCSCRAFVDEEFVGECWIMLQRDVNSRPEALNRAQVQWIGVTEPWRQRGVGRQMLTHACHRLDELGVSRLQLITSCDNLRAQAFYYLAGLRVVDEVLGFQSDPGMAGPT